MMTYLNSGGHFPNKAQTLLLKAALFEKSIAQGFYLEWLELNKFNKLENNSETFFSDFMDPLDLGSQRLLPLVAENIGTDFNVSLKALKGYQKNVWVRNQRIAHVTKKLIVALRENGIDSMIFKGLSLANQYYPSNYSRPMNDGDLLIRFEDRDKVLSLLNDNKLALKFSPYGSYMKDFIHAAHLHDEIDVDIDLHWNVFSEYGLSFTSSDFCWRDSVSYSLGDVKTKVLSPTHEFFVSLCHGRNFDPVPPFRWIADCSLILKKEEIDWPEIMELSRRFSFKPYLQKALPYLQDNFCSEIPESVIEEILSMTPSKEEKAHYNSISMNIRKSGFWGLIYYGTLRRFNYYKLFLKEQWSSVWVYLFSWYIQRLKAEVSTLKSEK